MLFIPSARKKNPPMKLSFASYINHERHSSIFFLGVGPEVIYRDENKSTSHLTGMGIGDLKDFGRPNMIFSFERIIKIGNIRSYHYLGIET